MLSAGFEAYEEFIFYLKTFCPLANYFQIKIPRSMRFLVFKERHKENHATFSRNQIDGIFGKLFCMNNIILCLDICVLCLLLQNQFP